GKYAQYDEFWSLVNDISIIRKQALQTVQDRTGLVIANQARFVLKFNDVSARSEFGASSMPVRSQIGDVTLVTISSEQLILGVMDIDASLVHEFIHGAMRQQMGLKNYRALPKWIREGIAVWGAGQLQERTRNVIAAAYLEERDPVSVVHQLDNMHNSSDDYLVDAILFEYIEQAHGVEVVRSLIARVVAGDNYIEAIEDATGLNWNELQRVLYKYAHGYFEEIISMSGLGEIQRAQKLYDWGKASQAIELLEELIATKEDPLLKPNAWYLVGRWSQELERFGLAAMAFTNVLDDYPDYIGLQDDSRFRLASCYVSMGEYEKALVELERFFKVHIQAPAELQVDAWFLFGRVQYALTNYLVAAQALRFAAQNRCNFVQDSFYYLCLAHLRSGEIFQSKLAMAELAFRYPYSKHLPKLKSQLDKKLLTAKQNHPL
ncbi:MAG: tetratricopeptide repeat protein, partial [Deltaproteobacteria bacterium]|nr:tetratricopeptide repeat protein [Deltaproteobacteria bacterium]